MYHKQELREILDELLNQKIQDVHYYSNYGQLQVFDQIRDIRHIPFLGLQLTTISGVTFSIDEFDCSEYNGLGGFIVESSKDINPTGLPDQINEKHWKRYNDAKIVSWEVFEFHYPSKNVNIPSGICFGFENGEVLYIVNSDIDVYDVYNHSYSYIAGQNFVLFFTKKALIKYSPFGGMKSAMQSANFLQ